MLDTLPILLNYYEANSSQLELLLRHSHNVARKAVSCAIGRRLDVDLDFVKEAALLHDIGIFRCYAPDIYCNGELPYICHGVEGRKILEKENLPRHALVCERHTGAGLTAEEIKLENLPIPQRDMLPLSIEERLICYADKFFSKSGNPDEEKSLEKVIASMQRHGDAVAARFMKLHEEFGS